MLEVEEKEGVLSFRIFVQPKSSKNQVAGLYADPVRGNALKVKITAPPVDGAANAMCIKFFAKFLGVSKSSVEIVSGQSSRSKRIALRLGDSSEEQKKRENIKMLLAKYI
ncbi:MAG: DUF167 domain-containing protein [Desulfobacterales bacterium]|nr:DUF167 domain-containing protein [Desulfobacterales bacterium]